MVSPGLIDSELVGENSQGKKMALRGTDPESYITECTSVYEEDQVRGYALERNDDPRCHQEDNCQTGEKLGHSFANTTTSHERGKSDDTEGH